MSGTLVRTAGADDLPLCRFDVDPNGIIWSDRPEWAPDADTRVSPTHHVGAAGRPGEASAFGPLAGADNIEDLGRAFHGEHEGEDDDEDVEFVLIGGAGPHLLSNPRAVILGLALLFSSLDPIPPSGDSADSGLDTHPLPEGQVTGYGAAHGHPGLFLAMETENVPHNAQVDNENPLHQQEWAPPPPPGPTLRDRVERLEREAGLRCCDALCCIGPSDEDPFVHVSEASDRFVRLLALGEDEGGKEACTHLFHPACLVSAQRAHGETEVVCSLCSTRGRVPPAALLVL
ncbi:hypothetical protein B0H13DRAFT_918430 [Mycena leptocephala]|nr:hypothetical protein B0H13DRAFT_918430 [Mycena leptocephala]